MQDGTTGIVDLYLPATIGVIMFTMGLGLVREDFARVLKEPRGVAVGLVGQLVVLPLLGFALAYAFGLPPEYAVGLVLVAACPGGPSSNLMTYAARGDVALSVTLTAISGVVTLITIPLIVSLAMKLFQDGTTNLHMPILDTMIRIALGMGLPLAIGFLTRARSKDLAMRIQRVTKVASTVMLFGLIVGAMVIERARIGEIASEVGLPTVILNVGGMLLGYLAARALALPVRQRVSIPLEVGAQNAALAIGIAVTIIGSEALAYPAVVYGIFMYIPCGIYILLARREVGEVVEAVA